MNDMAMTAKKVRAAVSDLLSEIDALRDMADEGGGAVAKDMIGFLKVAAMLEMDPDIDELREEFQEAWQDVMRHDATTMPEVAMKCRATMLYREGCKVWATDTFCDDDLQFL